MCGERAKEYDLRRAQWLCHYCSVRYYELEHPHCYYHKDREAVGYSSEKGVWMCAECLEDEDIFHQLMETWSEK
jgi:hypothetical protein